jgi:hypothetical protein
VFALADQEQGAGRTVHDAFRGAAKEDAVDAGVAVSRSDDEIDVPISGSGDDGFERCAGRDRGVRFDFGWNLFSGDFGKAFFGGFDQWSLVGDGEHRVDSWAGIERFDDMNDPEGGVELAGKSDRVGERFERFVGEIGRHQNAAQAKGCFVPTGSELRCCGHFLVHANRCE